jgi:hypothetical protein
MYADMLRYAEHTCERSRGRLGGRLSKLAIKVLNGPCFRCFRMYIFIYTCIEYMFMIYVHVYFHVFISFMGMAKVKHAIALSKFKHMPERVLKY